MAKMIVSATLAALLAIGAPAAIAQEPPAGQSGPVCPRDAAPLPASLVGWLAKTPLVAAADKASVDKMTVTPGVAVDLALSATPSVGYLVAPSRPGQSASYGGMVTLNVAAAGVYRVALGAGAWLDVIKDGAALTSVAHGHGPACSGIRKMVDFTLQPGRYVIQVAGSSDAHVGLLIARPEPAPSAL